MYSISSSKNDTNTCFWYNQDSTSSATSYITPTYYIYYGIKNKIVNDKSKSDKGKRSVKDLIKLWEDDNYHMVKVKEEKDTDGFTWTLYIIHSLVFDNEYGRHAVMRIKHKDGLVEDYWVFNIAMRNGENVEGISARGGE